MRCAFGFWAGIFGIFMVRLSWYALHRSGTDIIGIMQQTLLFMTSLLNLLPSSYVSADDMLTVDEENTDISSNENQKATFEQAFSWTFWQMDFRAIYNKHVISLHGAHAHKT